MRRLESSTRLSCTLAATVLLAASSASCARSFRNPFRPWTPPAPEVLVPGTSSLDQIIAAVNQNSQRIVSYQTTNASIQIPGATGVPTLSGKIAAQRPGRIRLEASTALTGKEVDLGANEELFWLWVRRSEPPSLYFSRHANYAGSAAQQLLPIEPQWLLDALGLVELRPTDFHEGPVMRDRDTVEIKSVVNSPSGQLVKRTVVNARNAWVLEQHVYDRSGVLLASAVARSHRYYEQAGASLPQEVDIQIPASGLSLSIDVGTVVVNGPVDNQQLWTLPTIPGAPVVDLGTSPPSGPGGMTPTIGDQLTRADWNDAAPGGGAPILQTPAPTFSPTPTSLPVAPPVPVAVAAPQIMPPGGRADSSFDPFQSAASAPVQQLPSGGVAAEPLFAR